MTSEINTRRWRGTPKPLHLVLICGLAVVLCAILFPVIAPEYDVPRRAYQGMINFHYADHLSRRETHPPFLCISWCAGGNVKHIENHAFYNNGRVKMQRNLWSYAIQGGEGQVMNEEAFQKLRALPAMPMGLPDARNTLYGRMVVLSQFQGGQKVIRYYDSAQLPAPVQEAIRLTKLITGAPGC